MAKYSLELNRTASNTLSVGFFQATATSPRRLKVLDWMFGSEATPASNAFLWTLNRVTAAGSPAGGSAVTPAPLDVADAAALFDCTEGPTTDPTITTTLLSIPLNQQATFRWVAAPGCEPTSPATDNLGFAVKTPTSSAVAVTTSLIIEEQ